MDCPATYTARKAVLICVPCRDQVADSFVEAIIGDGSGGQRIPIGQYTRRGSAPYDEVGRRGLIDRVLLAAAPCLVLLKAQRAVVEDVGPSGSNTALAETLQSAAKKIQ